MEQSAKKRRVCEYYGATTSPSCSHGMATSSGHDYEVFLSFRGPDTRATFTDFLYTSLKEAGIRTYRDDEDLRQGEVFGPELLQAINQSKISIPIFSKGYASNACCLKEVAQMVECKKAGKQKIMPIFYDVEPSEVRHQTGGYSEAFRSHKNKKRHDEKTMQEWKDALNVVGAINGWDLHSMSNRRGEFVKKLTEDVFKELKKAYLVVSDDLVKVDNHVDAIMEMIGAQTGETRIVGIHGRGGIGKTTVAKMIYNRLSHNFENCCFLHDIRETSKGKGIQLLQNQLISDILKIKCMDIKDTDEGTQTIKDMLSNKRVLILLDDVEEENHIDAFVGQRDWLGKGSKIIFTTRDKYILDVLEVDDSYELGFMDPIQSLQLFSKHAFRRDFPLDNYIDQSNRAMGIAGGLPLALEVIGSLLCRTKMEKWDLTLKMLESFPHDEVQSKLKISYDALDSRQKIIFLDIACLFIGYDKDILVHFWDESINPKEAMEDLQTMSLIKINEDNKVWMHNQLRDLGREIVRQNSGALVEKQSRVWDPKEGLDLLTRHKGKKKVQALHVKLDHEQYRFTYEDFRSLSDLRFFEVHNSMKNFCVEERLLWNELPTNVLPTNDFPENSDLLPQLRWLSWHDIAPTFKITTFSIQKMVILDLSESTITHNWKGWSHMKVMRSLKVLNLTRCLHLERTPIFSPYSKLEHLILEGCRSLIEIHESICQVKCLVSLDISYCENLQSLPDELGRGLASLEYLSLGDCVSLVRLPDSIGNLESLIELDISGMSIEELPHSIGNLKNLKVLKMSGSKISKIPESLWTIGNLESLIEWDISGTSIEELPHSIGNLKNLKVLKMSGSKISKIPESLWTIGKLEEIEGSYISGIHVKISNCIYKNQSLRILRLAGVHIYVLPRLPESLVALHLHSLNMDILPNLSNLANLKELNLSFGPPPDSDWKSDGFVEYPIPDSEHVTTSLTELSLLPQLKNLDLKCPSLRRIPRLPSSLSSLYLSNCNSLCSMEDLSNLKNLSSLEISSSAIAEIQGLGVLENLRDLRLERVEQVETLPDLSNLSRLRSLHVYFCDNLIEVQGELPQSLEELEISDCQSLLKLPYLSCLKELQKVSIAHCRKLKGEAILGSAQRSQVNFWEQLRILRICGLGQVEILPDLSNLNRLRRFIVEECDNLVEIQGELPESLGELEISDCQSLLKLPDLSSLKELQKVSIAHCWKSKHKAILSSAWRSQENFCEKINSCILRNKSLRILKLRWMDIYALPRLPESLIQLQLSEVHMDMFPDLSNLANLKELDLEFHSRDSDGESDGLLEYPIPQWIGNLSKLESLALRCHFVTTSPTDLSLPPHLKALHLKCPNLRCLPRLPSSLSSLHLECCLSLCLMEDLSNLKKLSFLEIWQGAITEIPGLGCLENLRDLMLCGLGRVQRLPDLSSLNILRSLQVRFCDNLVEIQGELPRSLDKLVIQSCRSLRKLPDTSSLMDKQVLEIRNCSELNVEAILGCAWKNPRDLQIIGFDQLEILADLSDLRKSNELRRLQVAYCGNLVEIQGELPESLEIFEIDSCESLRKLPDLSSLMELREVCIGECGNLVEIQCELPKSLEKLEIYFCQSLQKLPTLSSLMGLREVCIGECGNLVEIQGELPESLEELKISFCESLQKLPIMSSLMGLRDFCIGECGSLVEIQGELPQSLEKLEIQSCGSLQKLPYLSNLLGLREVCIEKCGNMVEIQGELPQSLEKLEIRSCGSLQDLPYLSSLLGLRELCIEKCGNLVEIQGELPQSLEELKISFCKSLQKLPNLSSLKELRKVEIDCCRKLNMETIHSLCLEKSVEFVGEDESESEQEGEHEESESEGEDAKSGSEQEGEDEESE